MTDDASKQPHPSEPTVRQLLDDPQGQSQALDQETLAELQRWFGMPSAMDLPPEPESESETRRQAALDAVDPRFLDYLHRIDDRLPRMLEIPALDLRTDEKLATVPERFSAAGRLGEPREIEISYQLEDDLKECVPQALLRDLHRTEEYFHLHYEVTQICDTIPDIRRDVAAAIARGVEERQLVSLRDEFASSVSERTTPVHEVAWATLSRVAPDHPADAGEEQAT